MKTPISVLILSALMSASASAQGLFLFSNFSAPTRLGVLDGPLAGSGIWAQMLVRVFPDNLLPVGEAREHAGDGLVGGVVYTEVPGIPGGDLVSVQMVAWDGVLWGSALAAVPPGQLGRTDIVSVQLSSGFPFPVSAPRFTQPAIVPIPEPSVLALGALVGALVSLHQRMRRRP